VRGFRFLPRVTEHGSQATSLREFFCSAPTVNCESKIPILSGLSTVDCFARFCPLPCCLFSCKYELPNLQVLCFDNHPTVPGGSRGPNRNLFQESFNSVPPPSSPSFSKTCALFCATAAPQLFWNQFLAHSFHHHGGVYPSRLPRAADARVHSCPYAGAGKMPALHSNLIPADGLKT
jgi:hypothetical protein